MEKEMSTLVVTTTAGKTMQWTNEADGITNVHFAESGQLVIFKDDAIIAVVSSIGWVSAELS